MKVNTVILTSLLLVAVSAKAPLSENGDLVTRRSTACNLPDQVRQNQIFDSSGDINVRRTIDARLNALRSEICTSSFQISTRCQHITTIQAHIISSVPQGVGFDDPPVSLYNSQTGMSMFFETDAGTNSYASFPVDNANLATWIDQRTSLNRDQWESVFTVCSASDYGELSNPNFERVNMYHTDGSINEPATITARLELLTSLQDAIRLSAFQYPSHCPRIGNIQVSLPDLAVTDSAITVELSNQNSYAFLCYDEAGNTISYASAPLDTATVRRWFVERTPYSIDVWYNLFRIDK